MKKLPLSFYNRNNVTLVARDLIGKILVSCIDNKITAGRIVETEAYHGIYDRASHAFAGRRTPRNEHMYGAPGISYVYICYGMHHMMNVVTNKREVPDAVLLRALEPLEGIEVMLARTGKLHRDVTLTRGPGNLCRAMGISKQHSGISLRSEQLYIAEDGYDAAMLIGESKRIGIAGAGEIAVRKPWRFYLKGNPNVSGYPKM